MSFLLGAATSRPGRYAVGSPESAWTAGWESLMVAFDVRLETAEWLNAWKADSKHLVVNGPTTTRLRDRVAVRVQLVQPPVRATVLGTVTSLQRDERHHRVEVAVEAESLGATRILVAAALGEPVTFRERAPRFLAKLPVLTSRAGTSFYVNTVSVSASGCSVRWSGPLPTVGEALTLSFRGSRSVDLRGVVRWRRPAGSTVGLAFVERAGATDAWLAILDGVKKSGAPPT